MGDDQVPGKSKLDGSIHYKYLTFWGDPKVHADG